MTKVRNPWAVLFALCVGQSLGLLNSTVVNVAIPAISAELGASIDQILWVVNVYILVLTALTMVGARFGDLFSPKRMYLAGLGVFTVASVACGLAQSPGQLIGARVVQAVGSAMMSPQTLSIITKVFPADRRGAAIGVWGSFAGLSVAVAPSLGGLLVSALDWRWVFYMNVPIGVAGFVLAVLIVPNVPAAASRRLDLVGIGLLTGGLFLITYALIESVPLLLAAGVAAVVAFVWVERGRQDRDPLLPFVVVKDRNFSLMSGVTATIACGIGCTFLLVFLHLQVGAGMSALTSGLLVAVAPLVSVFFSPLSGRLTDRYGGKYVLVCGLVLSAAGIGLLALETTVTTSWQALLPALFVLGAGMGIIFSPGGTIAMRTIDPANSGAASGVLSLSRMVGSSVGSAAAGAVLQLQLAAAGAAGSDFGSVPPQAITDAVRVAYLLPVAVLVVGAGLSLAARTTRPAPAGM
nr:MFS transporter [Kibdelosporangium sp. MJ126-NF4]CEL18508.1 drug resistance transporter, EmrB-QacA subfamily subfamily [Kibdelosporangium sp. MJ126-NF4]CTQ97992.1 drug resistance transporter, EmrB-QacA subfamily subfamily [Kibdelosporangium sp. MJ126-NF4]